jgi:hypothetical protein
VSSPDEARTRSAGPTPQPVAGGRYLLLLDPLARAAEGALDALVSLADSDPAIGAVGAKLIGRDGRLQEAGGIVFADGSVAGYGRGDDPADPRYCFVREVDFCSSVCLLVRAEAFGGLDADLTDPLERSADLCLGLRAAGYRVLYQPAAEVVIDVAHAGKAQAAGEDIQRLRPAPFAARPGPALRVLVLGIYLADRPNTADDCVESFASARHEVVQRWIALGGEPPAAMAGVTADVVLERTPKYELLQRLLDREDLDTFDFVITTDDDVVVQRRFLDSFLPLQAELGFALAQPARTATSFVDHPIVVQQRGLLGRETRFVEIGPIVSVAREAYDVVFPFDEGSSMGWGYENVWAHRIAERALRMGIVDAVPVDHSFRPPVANYNWRETAEEAARFLRSRPHLASADCLRVLEVFPLPEAA